MKIRGNAKLKMIALGLLDIAVKLARVMENIAPTWLYCLDIYKAEKVLLLFYYNFKRHSCLDHPDKLFNVPDC